MIELFKALSDQTRLRILAALWDHAWCVCELEKGLDLTQSNTSRHLAVLRAAGFLNTERYAQWIYYRLNPEFREEHGALYDYLSERLKSMPSYKDDIARVRQCRDEGMCNLPPSAQKEET